MTEDAVAEWDRRTARTRELYRIWRAERMADRVLIDGRLTAPVPDAQHGRHATYVNHGCRCQRCTEARRTQGRAERRTRY